MLILYRKEGWHLNESSNYLVLELRPCLPCWPPRLLARRVRQAILKAAEQVELLGREVPGELAEQVVHVLLDGLVLANLLVPDLVEVAERERLLLDQEAQDLL